MDFIDRQTIILFDIKNNKLIKNYYSPPSGLTIPQLHDRITTIQPDNSITVDYKVIGRLITYQDETQVYTIQLEAIS